MPAVAVGARLHGGRHGSEQGCAPVPLSKAQRSAFPKKGLRAAGVAAFGADQGQRAERREPGLAALPEGHGGERRIALTEQHREQGVMGVGCRSFVTTMNQ